MPLRDLYPSRRDGPGLSCVQPSRNFWFSALVAPSGRPRLLLAGMILLLMASLLPCLADEGAKPKVCSAEDVVAAWNDIGAAHKISEEVLMTTATFLEDAISLVEKEPDEEFVRRFRKSLPFFLELHAPDFRKPKEAEGTGRWLAYCTAEALARVPLEPEDRKLRLAEYRELYRSQAQYLEQRVRQQPPGKPSQKLDKHISQGFASWLDAVVKRDALLQDDLLFPCLRGPVSKKMREALRKHYTEDRSLPQWKESPYREHLRQMLAIGHQPRDPLPGVAVTREEYFIVQVDRMMKYSVSETLFWLSLADIDPELRVNRYWGHTLVSGCSPGEGVGWPFCLSLRVNETTNAEKGWRPGDRR